MGLLEASGCVAAAFSAAAVLFGTVVAPEPERIILMMASGFAWILTVAVVSAIWMATSQLHLPVWLLVLYATVLQELSRWFTYVMFVRVMRALDSIGLQTEMAQSLQQTVPSAVASGLGVGVVQVLVMYGDVFSRAALPGSLYREGCPAMSTFALDAVCSSAFILLNVCLTIIGWTATYPRYLRTHAALMLGLHLAASAATGLSAHSGMTVSGCFLSLPLLALVLVATGGLAARCALVSSHEARQVIRTRCS